MATFNFGFGAEVKFKQAMAITMYAFLPGIIKALIATAVVGMGAAEGFTFQNQVASNLGGLVDPTSSHFLYAVLTSIDAFTIWTLVLTGIGYSCVTRVKRGTCMGVVFGWWMVVTLVGAGIGCLVRVDPRGQVQWYIRPPWPLVDPGKRVSFRDTAPKGSCCRHKGRRN